MNKDQVMQCIPSDGDGVHISDIYRLMSIVHMNDEPKRKAVRKIVVNALDRGELKTNQRFALTQA